MSSFDAASAQSRRMEFANSLGAPTTRETAMRHYIRSKFLPLIFGSVILYGCSPAEKPKSNQARSLLADSATRSLIEQEIVSNDQMRRELFQHISERMDMDTLLAGEVCGMMMRKAQTDVALAGHMCEVVASDTMMSKLMARTLASRPTSSAGRSNGHRLPTTHDKTRVERNQ